ncbi:MAG: hypothetical protein Q7T87_15185 [Polaromonas sp.]|nr:hypothetical protein [Polaromonas sp.]
MTQSFRFPVLVLAAVLAGVMAGCSPAFNWRDARFDDAELTALLPCKPDRASRPQAIGGATVTLSMMGCEAGGAMFAVVMADAGDASRVARLQADWQAVTLANIRAMPVGAGDPGSATHAAPLRVGGADAAPGPVLVTARGQGADGQVVMSQAAYFSRGSRVFQAVVYAEKMNPDAAEAFFSGLRLP